MISGMYMGELVRRVIVECAEAGVLFGGKCTVHVVVSVHSIVHFKLLSYDMITLVSSMKNL